MQSEKGDLLDPKVTSAALVFSLQIHAPPGQSSIHSARCPKNAGLKTITETLAAKLHCLSPNASSRLNEHELHEQLRGSMRGGAKSWIGRVSPVFAGCGQAVLGFDVRHRSRDSGRGPVQLLMHVRGIRRGLSG